MIKEEKKEMECEKEVENGRYIIVVSGVSKGIGRALALEFAKLGHIIVGCSRNQNQLDSLQHHLSTISSLTHLLIKVDVVSNSLIFHLSLLSPFIFILFSFSRF